MEKPPAPLTVVVADDDPLARAVLRDTLTHGAITVAGEASTGREAVEVTVEVQPDVLLLDLTLPDGDGIDVTRQLRALDLPLAIVVLSSRANDEMAVAALRAGASGFLTKDVAVGILPRALRAVVDGEPVVSRRLTRVVLDRLRETPEDGLGLRPVRSRLTPREWEVLDLLCQGRTIPQIADDLLLSTDTVRSHVKQIMRKTGTRSREEAVAHASVLRRSGRPGAAVLRREGTSREGVVFDLRPRPYAYAANGTANTAGS